MLPKLSNSKRAKKELKYFKSEIDKISNTDVKKKALSILSNLSMQINTIQESHVSTVNKGVDPRRLRENIETLVLLRNQLNKIIKDANT